MRIEREDWFNSTPDEEIIWHSNPSFILHLPHLLFGVILSLISLVSFTYLYFFTEWPEMIAYISLLLLPAGVIYSGWKMLDFKNKHFVITSKNVVMKQDILGHTKSSKPHREIVRVDSKVTTTKRVLSKLTSEDIGDLVVRTADDSGPEFVMKNIPEVGLAEKHIQRLCGSDIGGQSEELIEDMATQQSNTQPTEETTNQSQHTNETPTTTDDSSTHTPQPPDPDSTDTSSNNELEQYEPSDNA